MYNNNNNDDNDDDDDKHMIVQIYSWIPLWDVKYEFYYIFFLVRTNAARRKSFHTTPMCSGKQQLNYACYVMNHTCDENKNICHLFTLNISLYAPSTAVLYHVRVCVFFFILNFGYFIQIATFKILQRISIHAIITQMLKYQFSRYQDNNNLKIMFVHIQIP